MKADSRPIIVLLSAAAGSGHMVAGENLAHALRTESPEWCVHHLDVSERSRPWLRALITWVWKSWSTTPILASAYSLMHRLVLSSDRIARIYSILFGSIASDLEREFAGADVRAVLALHPAATAAATRWRLTRKFFLGSVATDLIVHGLHALPSVDAVYADREAVRVSPAAQKLVSDGRMVFSGLPVGAQFFKRRSLPVEPGHVVVTFGGCGIVRGWKVVSTLVELVKAEETFKFTIVCGTNEVLFRRISRMMQDAGVRDRVIVVKFVDDMRALLESAVCVIGKPGGISVGEALALRLPFGIVDLLPGQEEANAKVILKSGMGFVVEPRDTGRAGASLSATLAATNCRWGGTTFEAQGVEAITRHLQEVVVRTDRA